MLCGEGHGGRQYKLDQDFKSASPVGGSYRAHGDRHMLTCPLCSIEEGGGGVGTAMP